MKHKKLACAIGLLTFGAGALYLKHWIAVREMPADSPQAPVAQHQAPAALPAVVPEATVPNVSASIPTEAPSAVATTPAVSFIPASAASAVPLSPVVDLPRVDPVKAGEELQKTEKTFLSHVELRREDIANPNSPENRRVMATMVAKALSQAKADENAAQGNSTGR